MGNACSCSKSSSALIKDSNFEKNKITILTPDGEKVIYLDQNDDKHVDLKPTVKGYQNTPSPLNNSKFHPKLRASPSQSVSDSPNPNDSHVSSPEYSVARTPKDIMAMSSHIARTRHSFTALSNNNSNSNTNLSHVKDNSTLRRSLNYSNESRSSNSNSISVNSKTSSPNGKGSQTSLSGKSNNSIPNSPESLLSTTLDNINTNTTKSEHAEDGNDLLINRFSIRNFITSAINTSPLRTPRSDRSPTKTPQNSSPTHHHIVNELERDSIASLYNYKNINTTDSSAFPGVNLSQLNENDENQINIYRESLRLHSRTITNKSLETEIDNENSNLNKEEGVKASPHSSYDNDDDANNNNIQKLNNDTTTLLHIPLTNLTTLVTPAIIIPVPESYEPNSSSSLLLPLESPVKTKWIRVLCPKQKIKIRQQPTTTSEITGYITHEDEFEVFQKVCFGFYQFADNRVSNIFIYSE